MTADLRNPRSIAITGASSGIGEALARRYAAPGVTLALAGRDESRLAAVAAHCREAGAAVTEERLDVTDEKAVRAWLAECHATRALELVVANAGISAGTGENGEDEAQARELFAVNLAGVLNTVLPAVALMRPRRCGQIAIMSSLAGYLGFPGAPAYCASKAAVRVWGEALRGHLAGEGIAVSVICPGFVRSRMTAINRFPMPFLMETEEAAEIIQRGLARNSARIAFPWPMVATVRLLSALPPGLAGRLLRRLPTKPSGGGAERGGLW